MYIYPLDSNSFNVISLFFIPKKISMINIIKKPILVFVLFFNFVAFTVAQDFTEDLQKLQWSYKLISSFYVDSVDNKKLVEDAIVGMLTNLDPHSEYLSPEEVSKLTEPLDGSFEGIGIQFNILKDTLMVVTPISGGPSEKVGLQAGDRIIYINDENVAGIGLKNSGVQERLKGKKGTKVTLKVKRGGFDVLLDFTITRDKIPIYSVEASYMATSDIGYVKINQFSSTTHKEFISAVNTLINGGMKSLVLDLRGNPGGYLKAATDVADEFLEEEKLIVYTEGLSNPKREYFSTNAGLLKDVKVVVLINEGSASASEIVTGAIQDWDRGIVVGRRSFGKGLVQRPFNLHDGSMIKLTIAKYYTPSGRCIQKPYDKGKDDYQREVYERFDNNNLDGENDRANYTEKDAYYTRSSNRIVYGGGGIHPDVVVPIDTSGYSDFYRALIAGGIVNNFSLSYLDKNRNYLIQKYQSFELFNKGFSISDKAVDEIIQIGKKDFKNIEMEGFENSIPFLKIQLKALIARNLWSNTEYYKVINPTVNDYNKALEILTDDRSYSKVLN